MLIGQFHYDDLASQACRVGKDFGQRNNLPLLCLMVLFILTRSKNICTVYVHFCMVYLFVSDAMTM
jgi:hypothetical protein